MKTILLIEDNDDIRGNISEILELAQYQVLSAPNGKVGVELANTYHPDLIVCDIMMPVLDGYGVIHMIQKNPEIRNTPFIFLTAKAERAEIRKGMELGADDYIIKPFNGSELLNAIESRFRKAGLHKMEIGEGLKGLDNLVSAVSGKEALKAFTENRAISSYGRKQTIYSEGKHPNSLFYIESGKVKTYKINDDGKELITGLYSEGDFFGYVALLEVSNYRESAETLEECEIAAIPKKEYDELLKGNRDVQSKFFQLLANKVSEKEEQLLQMAYNSLRKKIANALIFVSKKYKTPQDEQCVIDITRENLSNIAGTAKESLIRALSDFKDEKIIDIRQGDIVILDEKRLLNLIN